MSNIYSLEPPTKGKVILHTTFGDLEIELWAKEAPKAVRNFVQLCMEGYYDGTKFFRLMKDYMVQGGDPTNTGEGGQSIYGGPFPDEFHSRLKFNRRGLVACANQNTPNTNGSQFFITLDKAEWLDKRNTIFGRVVGDTIYNLLRFNEVECDEEDHPLDPPALQSAEVVWNPFEDIVPRVDVAAERERQKAEKQAAEAKKRAQGRTKNLALLSFGDEAEEEEEELRAAIGPGAGTVGRGGGGGARVRSAHDVLEDERLAREKAVDEEELRKRLAEEAAAAKAGTSGRGNAGEADGGDVDGDGSARGGEEADDGRDFAKAMHQRMMDKRRAMGDAPKAKAKREDDDDGERERKRRRTGSRSRSRSRERSRRRSRERSRSKGTSGRGSDNGGDDSDRERSRRRHRSRSRSRDRGRDRDRSRSRSRGRDRSRDRSQDREREKGSGKDKRKEKEELREYLRARDDEVEAMRLEGLRKGLGKVAAPQVADADLLKPWQLAREQAKARSRVLGKRDKDVLARLSAFTQRLRTGEAGGGIAMRGKSEEPSSPARDTSKEQEEPAAGGAAGPSGASAAGNGSKEKGYSGKVREDIDHKAYMPAAWRVDDYLKDDEDDDDLASLRHHTLAFAKNERKDDMERNNDDDYVVFDPLLEKGKGKFSKAAQKEKKRGTEWAGRAVG